METLMKTNFALELEQEEWLLLETLPALTSTCQHSWLRKLYSPVLRMNSVSIFLFFLPYFFDGKIFFTEKIFHSVHGAQGTRAPHSALTLLSRQECLPSTWRWRRGTGATTETTRTFRWMEQGGNKNRLVNNSCKCPNSKFIQKSSSMTTSIMNTTARFPTDKPVILFYALVGNDVCNGFKKFLFNGNFMIDFGF